MNPTKLFNDPVTGRHRILLCTSRETDMKTTQTIKRSLLVLICGILLQNAYAAGQIDLVEGNVSVTTAAGQLRIPGKGERIEAGDTISTGRGGEIHVHMDDNGLIAVRANTFLKIESYKAEGTKDDGAVFRLLRGSFRSITGWIGKNSPQRYAVLTPTATVGIRGTDHETMVVDDGAEAGTYDKVNTGETELVTPHGKVFIKPGHAAFSPKAGAEPPKLLAAIPLLFVPTHNEAVIEVSKKTLENSRDERLQQKRKDNERKGTNKEGKAQVGDPQEGRKALATFEDLLRAFEAGDVSQIRRKLDPSMIGYQQLLDNITLGNNECKQMRVNLLNTQVQAGPDLTVIQTSWEKRCLLLPAFTPKMASGRATVLLHLGSDGWTFAAITAGNMFDRFAVSVITPSKPNPTGPTTPGTTPVPPPVTTPVPPPVTTPVPPPAVCRSLTGAPITCPPTTTPTAPPPVCTSPLTGAVITCPPTTTPTAPPPVVVPITAPTTCTVSGRVVPCSSIRSTALCTRRGSFLICP